MSPDTPNLKPDDTPEPAASEHPKPSVQSDSDAPSAAPPGQAQPRNPLHGLTLQAILQSLVDAYGWPGLAERIALRCFEQQPSIASSLKVLRKTPWARDKVESLYLFLLRERKRGNLPPEPPPQP